MIFKFFLSSLCNQPPQAAVFDIVPSPENFLLHSKTLWKYYEAYPENISTNLIINSLNLQKTIAPNDMESLFYLTSKIKNPENYITEDQIQLGNYFLPIYYNIKKIPELPAKEIINNIEIQLLYGEALIKTIIMLHRLNDLSLYSKATDNLNFISKSDPLISKDLLNELIQIIVKSISFDVNYYSISTFFLNSFNQKTFF